MRHSLPPVTIAIPFFNAEATLLDALKSVFAQTHQDWELILLDDGSSDRSLGIARSIDDPRITVYSDGSNKRLASRLNEIVSLARYDYIARMDADDLMSRDRIEQQLRHLIKRQDLDLVSTGLVSVSKETEATGVRCMPSGYVVTSKSVLKGSSGIVHAAVVARRDWLQRNPYDESLKVGQDTDLWIRACAKEDFNAEVLPLPLYFYREDGNVTYAKLKEGYRTHRRAIINASTGYSLNDRISAYGVSIAKSAGAFLANQLGQMNLIRCLRNRKILSFEQKAVFEHEIQIIRDTPLPFRIENRVVNEH